MTTDEKLSGPRTPGRFIRVRSLMHKDGSHSVIMGCDGGDLYFQHNMTPDEARELAGYLQAEANYVERQSKPVLEVA